MFNCHGGKHDPKICKLKAYKIEMKAFEKDRWYLLFLFCFVPLKVHMARSKIWERKKNKILSLKSPNAAYKIHSSN